MKQKWDWDQDRLEKKKKKKDDGTVLTVLTPLSHSCCISLLPERDQPRHLVLHKHDFEIGEEHRYALAVFGFSLEAFKAGAHFFVVALALDVDGEELSLYVVG